MFNLFSSKVTHEKDTDTHTPVTQDQDVEIARCRLAVGSVQGIAKLQTKHDTRDKLNMMLELNKLNVI
jgi:predicted FMN-binding regulatory protein PaiB